MFLKESNVTTNVFFQILIGNMSKTEKKGTLHQNVQIENTNFRFFFN